MSFEPPVPPHGRQSVDSLWRLVGNTPLLRMDVPEGCSGIEVYAKLEYFNPGGSVKDRAALSMIQEAQRRGALGKDRVLIDSTSGNTGVAYAWLGAALGLKVALVMPSNVSAARKRITSAFGAELIFSDPMEGSDGAIRHVRRLVEEAPERYFYPDQYSNEANPLGHYHGTGEEIWQQTEGRVTHLVAGIGTGGTVMGTGRRLKDFRREIQVIAVEPAEPMHGLEGLKHMPSSIVPAIFRESELDEKLSISTEDGWELAEALGRKGLLVGHSSGAALAGAYTIARRLSAKAQPGVIVTVFPDRADRYFEPTRWEKRFSF